MKRLFVVILLLLIISSPVFAFSVKEFLIDFKGIFTITGSAAPPPACSAGQTRCGYSNECSGSPCVMACSSAGQWVEQQYCSYQCSNSACVSASPPACSAGQTRCGYSNECSGSPCVMACSSAGQWIEQQYCSYQCSNGACVSASNTTNPPPTQECSDGTPYNSCNTNLKYCNNGILEDNCNICGCPTGKQCTNNQCIIESEPYDPDGNERGNQGSLNNPPIIITIGTKTVKINENIQFKINAMDRDNDMLNFYFDNNLKTTSTEIVTCSISDDMINCRGNNPGEGTLALTASDGKDTIKEDIKIIVLPKLPKLQKGIAAGIANTPPVADAGSDKIGIPGVLVILDASKSYDREGFLSTDEAYKWYENNDLIGTGKITEKIFSLGDHQVKLMVIDSEGLTSEDMIIVSIKEKTACKNTQTIYYPEDTLCNNKWPIKEGEEFTINSLTEGSCSLFEVCSDDMDYVIEDSSKCCTEELTDPEKASACSFALENSETLRNCQALYIIKSLGKQAIYMKDYFDAEMCCKGVEALCPSASYLYTPQPLPEYLKGVKCPNTPENSPNGVWKSDTRLELNEIALFDAPAHTSLNIIKTGTCVDYSVVATTLMRKIGFSKEDMMSVETVNHAYNLIRFDLDKKYTIFDTTGNNDGLSLGKVPKGYDYCEEILNCFNDLGKINCPSNEEIIGCENTEQKIGRTTQDVGFKIKNIFARVYDKIKFEVLR